MHPQFRKRKSDSEGCFFSFPKKTDGVAVSCSYKLLINVQLLLKFSASATQSENNYII